MFHSFSEGLALVGIGGKAGFIDKSGKVIINPQFDGATPFFNGLAAIRVGQKFGFVNKGGKIVINPEFDEVQPFVNGLAAVKIDELYGFINRSGKIVINPQFDKVQPFSSEGLAAVMIGQKLGFIDTSGRYLINPQFNKIDEQIFENVLNFPVNWAMAFLITPDIGRMSFSEGLSPIQLGEGINAKTGFIDKRGKIIISSGLVMAFPFYGGFALGAYDSGELAWIDKTGKVIWRETKKSEVDAEAQYYTQDVCRRYFIFEYLYAVPKLQTTLVDVENGVATLTIQSNASPQPFPFNTINAIRSGKSFQSIRRSDPTVSVLIKADRKIKTMLGIRSVVWTAHKPIGGEIISQTVTSGLGSHYIKPCSKYRR